MRFIIVICLFFAALPVLAQTAKKVSALDNTKLDTCQIVVDKEIEKKNREGEAKLTALTSQIEAAKLKLNQLKSLSPPPKTEKTSQEDPPYSWPATQCGLVAGSEDTIKCLWHFKNVMGTDICEASWVIEDDKWYQDTNTQCQEIPKVICIGADCAGASPSAMHGGLGKKN